ncbi:MAG: hypothetical protein JWP01_4020 [Myxococcales bacterium]|nr:hypothetical protein [Myxococcales bacterium]
MQATDTSAIQRLIGRARFRIRSQWALEGATTATILAAASALVSIFAMRIDLVSRGTGIGLLVASGLIILVGAAVSAARKIDDEAIARRIDRASNLADRLSTAIAFRSALGGVAPRTEADGLSPAAGEGDDETSDLMIAAIKDGVRAVPRANVIAAAPIRAPKDLRAAGAFLVVSALAAGLIIPPRPDRMPTLFRADPDHARPGEVVYLRGNNLLTGVAAPIASLRTRSLIGAPGTQAKPKRSEHDYVPADASVYLGPSDKARPVKVLDWTYKQIKIRIPEDAPIGDTILTVYIGKKAVGPVTFTVVDLNDTRYHQKDAVILEADERAYVDSILEQLKAAAQRDDVPELAEFAKKIDQLLKDAEQGKITKEQLVDALQKAEDALEKEAEPNQAEVDKQMGEMGKELAKEQVTKELGEALQKNDLQKAQDEMEKLADKLDPKDPKELEKEMAELKKQLENKDLTEQEKQQLQKQLDQKMEQLKNEKPLSEKEKEQLQKKLEQVAEQMKKQDKDQKQKQEMAQQKLQDEIKRLQKKKEQAKNEQEKLDAERQLAKKKDELQKLNKDSDDKEQSAQRQALKRLQKDVEKAAENLDKPQQDPNKSKEEQDQEQQEREKQASRNMKDAARETGRVDQDQRKQATQKKMSSQMDDLREAMRRAKQKGNKGPQDPFGKQGKNKDFQARARGQKGSGQAWKPGQGQPGGQGQGQGQQPGGQGNQPGGDQWGTGTDSNLTGDSTAKTGNTKDQDIQGQQGTKGTSRRETILAAAQKGFAGVGYKKVYADYQRIVEEVMRTEKLPASYKYYVKRYFAKIHPSTGDSTTAPAPTTTAPTQGTP